MKKLLIISGPTASGKTSLAFSLAKKFDGELISADSRQMYRKMDIVTGKEIDEKIKTRLIDVVAPDEQFSVSHYYQLAWKAIEDIRQRKKLPIIVGGTGFYIKAVLDGIETMGIAPDWKLRGEFETLTVDQLQEKLKQLDAKRWDRMNESDRKNPRRLVRAIEVTTLSGHPERSEGSLANARIADKRRDSSATPQNDISVLWIGLTVPNTILYQRIDQRVEERLKMGAVEETKELAKKYGWDIPSMTGQGYRQLRGFVEGKLSLEEGVKRWKFAEHEYARRQMTWFKKDKRIVWFDISDSKFQEKVEERLREWYDKT